MIRKVEIVFEAAQEFPVELNHGCDLKDREWWHEG
jgi:hypothetical protein